MRLFPVDYVQREIRVVSARVVWARARRGAFARELGEQLNGTTKNAASVARTKEFALRLPEAFRHTQPSNVWIRGGLDYSATIVREARQNFLVAQNVKRALKINGMASRLIVWPCIWQIQNNRPRQRENRQGQATGKTTTFGFSWRCPVVRRASGQSKTCRQGLRRIRSNVTRRSQ